LWRARNEARFSVRGLCIENSYRRDVIADLERTWPMLTWPTEAMAHEEGPSQGCLPVAEAYHPGPTSAIAGVYSGQFHTEILSLFKK
jgi:hypothetical protein